MHARGVDDLRTYMSFCSRRFISAAFFGLRASRGSSISVGMGQSQRARATGVIFSGPCRVDWLTLSLTAHSRTIATFLKSETLC